MKKEVVVDASKPLDIIQIVLIILKLFKLIDLSWGVILIPFWISIGILIVILIIYAVYEMKYRM